MAQNADVIAQALEARWSQSQRWGRPDTLAEVVIRMLILIQNRFRPSVSSMDTPQGSVSFAFAKSL